MVMIDSLWLESRTCGWDTRRYTLQKNVKKIVSLSLEDVNFLELAESTCKREQTNV